MKIKKIFDATCENDGEVSVTCDCGYSYEKYLPSLGHSRDSVVKKIEPTCTTSGYTVYHCDICGENFRDDYVGSSGHTEGEVVKKVEATCIDSGYTLSRCQKCGLIYESDYEWSEGHSCDEVVKKIESTCTEPGYTVYHCNACGEDFNDDYDWSDGHSKDAVIETVEPTYTEDGYTVYHCNICGEDFKDDYEYLWCYHDEGEAEIVKVVEPTCIKGGYTVYHCSTCGEDYEDNWTSRTGHSFENDKCTSCGYEIEEITLGTTRKVTLGYYEQAYFKFIPETSGTYYFYSYDNYRSNGYIYDGNMNLIEYCYSGDFTRSFKIEFDFEAGKTYYFRVEPEHGGWGRSSYESSLYTDIIITLSDTFENISIVPGSGVVMDDENGLIYGLDAGLSEYGIRNYIAVSDDYTYITEMSLAKGDKIGTGSTYTIYDTEVNSYTIIIFGDVNGDGWYDGQDAVMVSMLASGMLTREQVGEAAYMAADCNHDGVIDQADVDLLNRAGVLLSNVDQTLSTEKMLETAAYQEYSELIDQHSAFDSTDDSVKDNIGDVLAKDEAPLVSDFWTALLTFLEKIMKYLMSLLKIA